MIAASGVLPPLISAASAATEGDPAVWNVTPDRPLVAGVPTRIHVRGDATGTEPADPEGDTDPAAGVAILPPGVSCPGSFAEVTGATFQDAWHWLRGDPSSQPYDQSPAVMLHTPGTYLACGYFGLEGFGSLEDDSSATTVLYQPTPLVVARPTVDVDLTFDGPAAAGRTIRLTGTASSNAPETVTIQLNAADRPCGSTVTINQPDDRFGVAPEPFALYGGPQSVAVAVGLPTTAGEYRTCIYAHRDGNDGDPDLVQAGPSIVIDPPPAGPPAVPPAATGDVTVPPVQVAPPATPVDTSALTPVVDTTPPISCSIGRVAVRRGTTIAVRCPRATGTIGVRLRRVGRLPMQTSTLELERGVARLRTSRLRPGTWSTVVRHRGQDAGTIRFVVRPATTKKTPTREQAR